MGAQNAKSAPKFFQNKNVLIPKLCYLKKIFRQAKIKGKLSPLPNAKTPLYARAVDVYTGVWNVLCK